MFDMLNYGTKNVDEKEFYSDLGNMAVPLRYLEEYYV